MSSIQNADVKSLEEILVRGGTADRLIHDSKIWVTADDIFKPLDQAIIDGDIGAEVGVGSAYRNRTIVYGDGSTEELGALRPPYLVNDETVIETDYTFEVDEFIRVFVGGKEIVEFISETITPENYWYRESNNKIILSEDIVGSDTQVVIEVMDGVNLPPILRTLYAGLEQKLEAYGYTNNSNTPHNINSINVVNDKTQIELSEGFDSSDILYVYIDNEFYVPFKLGITTSKYYKKIDNRVIELDDDYSTQGKAIYISVFKGKYLQDDMGNIRLSLAPRIRAYAVESDSGNTFALGTEDGGILFTDDNANNMTTDELRFLTDDNRTVGLDVSDQGTLEVVENPSPGVIFEAVYLVSPDGTLWQMKINSEDEVYLELGGGSKFQLKDNYDNIIHEIEKTPNGSIFKLKHFNEGELPEDPDQLSDSALLAIEMSPSGPSLAVYNTLTEQWYSNRGFAGEIGEVIQTIHGPEKVIEIYGPGWVPMNGMVDLPLIGHEELAELMPEWVIDGMIKIPPSIEYDVGIVKANDIRNTPIYPPEGFDIGDHWAGISSFRRLYFKGDVDNNDTMVNDYNINTDAGYIQCNTYNSEQRATGYAQSLSLYRKPKTEKKYIKVR